MKTIIERFLLMLLLFSLVSEDGVFKDKKNYLLEKLYEISDPPYSAQRIIIAGSLKKYFHEEFEKTKLDLSFKKGKFDDIRIVIMPLWFPCDHQSEFNCSLDFIRPNYIKVSDLNIYKRAILPYLRFLNHTPHIVYDREAGLAGIVIDPTSIDFFKKTFVETKECLCLEKGDFEDISVVFTAPTFPCKHYESGCRGEYIVPNIIKIGFIHVWKHEVIHYLLYLNTRDSDNKHMSAFFKDCVV